MKILLRFLTALLFFIGTIVQMNAVEPARSRLDSLITSLSGDDDEELTEILRNMPNIEVGRGISFKPKNESYKLTMRFRMQNMVGVELNKDFTATETEARVKRLRLRFDGYIYSPKLTYSIQLGFTPYDAKVLPNGNMNIVRDAMVYYVPSAVWNVGFGQTKIKANRARTNSSSALQFVDRSIVNSEFNLDRDFGFFGEFNKHLFGHFDLAARASVTGKDGTEFFQR
ncbi:MAG: porin [Barnesiella sp.]